MMPFYPYYYKQLSEGGLRHTALLQPNTLRLFQQLTGKSSVRDTETAIQQEFGLLSGTRTATKCMEKMESFCAMPFLVRMELQKVTVKRNIQMKHILTGILWKKEIGKMAHLKVEFYAMNTKGLQNN